MPTDCNIFVYTVLWVHDETWIKKCQAYFFGPRAEITVGGECESGVLFECACVSECKLYTFNGMMQSAATINNLKR